MDMVIRVYCQPRHPGTFIIPGQPQWSRPGCSPVGALFKIDFTFSSTIIYPCNIDIISGVCSDGWIFRISTGPGHPRRCRPGDAAIQTPFIEDFIIPGCVILPDHMDPIAGVGDNGGII